MKHRLLLFASLTSALLLSACGGSSVSSTAVARASVGESPDAQTVDSIEQACVDTSAASDQIKSLRRQVCQQTNSERIKLGLKLLKLDRVRSAVAQGHAEDMVVNNFFSHTSPTTGSFTDRLRADGVRYATAGENIAHNRVINSEMIMNQWLTSAGHRANILNAAYGRLGVGVAKGRWVQVFTN